MYIEMLELCAWTPPTPDSSSDSQALEDAELLQRDAWNPPTLSTCLRGSAVKALEVVVVLLRPLVNNTCPHQSGKRR